MDHMPDLRISTNEEGLGATRQTAHEFVRSVLRRAILNGELGSGSRLVQAELAAMLVAYATLPYYNTQHAVTTAHTAILNGQQSMPDYKGAWYLQAATPMQHRSIGNRSVVALRRPWTGSPPPRSRRSPMRDSRPYGLMAAVLLAHKIEQARGRKRAPAQPKQLTEREQWNAAVDAKRAAKKARKEKP